MIGTLKHMKRGAKIAADNRMEARVSFDAIRCPVGARGCSTRRSRKRSRLRARPNSTSTASTSTSSSRASARSPPTRRRCSKTTPRAPPGVVTHVHGRREKNSAAFHSTHEGRRRAQARRRGRDARNSRDNPFRIRAFYNGAAPSKTSRATSARWWRARSCSRCAASASPSSPTSSRCSTPERSTNTNACAPGCPPACSTSPHQRSGTEEGQGRPRQTRRQVDRRAGAGGARREARRTPRLRREDADQHPQGHRALPQVFAALPLQHRIR